MGRLSDFTPETAALICERMAKGESLRSICRDDGMPAESTVRLWAIDNRGADAEGNGGFAAQYARAREAQMDALAEDILDIADDSRNDIRVDQDGKEVVDHELVQRSRLRVDSRKWLMSKIAPKRYGDKVELEHSGKDGAPIIPVINVTIGSSGSSSSSQAG